MRRYLYKRAARRFHRRRHVSSKKILFLFLLFIICVTVYAEKKLPYVRDDLQEAALRTHAQEQIAETVLDFLQDSPIQPEGNLVTLDTYMLSQRKAELTCALQEALSGKTAYWVPIGNLTGSALLNGHGVKIPVTFSVDGTASVEFCTELASAGINRTQYRVEMQITAVLHSTSAAYPQAVTVETSYPVYESVLTGEVPQFVSGIS